MRAALIAAFAAAGAARGVVAPNAPAATGTLALNTLPLALGALRLALA